MSSPAAARARWSYTPLGLAALIASYIAIAEGIGATVVGVFCVGFINALGAPLDVMRPAMAGFAVQGSTVTAVPLVIALVLLVIGMIRRMPARWWVTPAVINGLTIVGLLIASLIWYRLS